MRKMELKSVLSKIKSVPNLPKVDLAQFGVGTEAVMGSMDWAYDQCINPQSMFGVVDAITLAEEYKAKNSSIKEACDKLIKKELTKLSGIGFLTSVGGSTTSMVNIPVVFFFQLRIVIALAHLGGKDVEDPLVKTMSQMCLLGNQAVGMGKKYLLEKCGKDAIKKVAQKLALKVGAKKGITGIVPIVSGVIGSSLDVVTTLGIAKAAKEMFLKDCIQSEEDNRIAKERIKLLCKMILIDNIVAQEEMDFLKEVIEDAYLSETEKEELMGLLKITDGETIDVNYKVLKKDKTLALNILSSVVAVMYADGKIDEKEIALLDVIAKELSISPTEVKDIEASCKIVS